MWHTKVSSLLFLRQRHITICNPTNAVSIYEHTSKTSKTSHLEPLTMRASTLMALGAAIVNVFAAPTKDDDFGHGWDIEPFAITYPYARPMVYNNSLEMAIDPATLLKPTRYNFCASHCKSCVELCDGHASRNICDIHDLSYECLCMHNNSIPGLQYYAQTMPTYICKALYEQCRGLYGHSEEDLFDCKESFLRHCGTLPLEWTKLKNEGC